MIRVLITENDDRMVKILSAHFRRLSPNCEIDVATNRDDSVRLLREEKRNYDLIVCDILIFPNSSSVDENANYGLEVQSAANSESPGTPCLFFTGHYADVDVSQQLSDGPRRDIFGSGVEFSMVQIKQKLRTESAVAYLEAFSNEWFLTDAIELVFDDDLKLDAFEQRVVKILARRHAALSVHLTKLGGLSGAKTFRARMRGANGISVGTVFGKVQPVPDVEDEEARAKHHVFVHIDPSRVPSLADVIVSGAGRTGGIFYSLAERFDRSLFAASQQGDFVADTVVRCLQAALRPWVEAARTKDVSVRQLREERVTSEFLELHMPASSSWRILEEQFVNLKCGPQHGDLHGENVLVSAELDPMFIDFGDVGEHPVGLDPVTLGTSLFFHKEGPLRSFDWANATSETSMTIGNLPALFCSSDVMRLAFEWAKSEAGDLGFAVLMYVHAVRQLKYPDSDKHLAVAVADRACQDALALLS